MSATEPLSPLDATFLELEEADATAHMHIGGVLVFDPLPGGGTPDARAAAPPPRARASTRCRATASGSRAARPAACTGRRGSPTSASTSPPTSPAPRCPGPAASASCSPGRPTSGRTASTARRPLWRMVLLEGLAGGRWALVDQDPPLPRGRRRLGRRGHRAARRRAASPRAAGRRRRTPPGREPAPAGRRCAAWPACRWPPPRRPSTSCAIRGAPPRRSTPPARSSSCSCATSSSPRRSTSLNVPLSEHRRLAVTEVPLEEIKAIKRALGGTVNDVVLALVTAGLRDLLLAARRDAARRAACARWCRSTSATRREHLELGNRITSLFVHLPVAVAEPRRALPARAGRDHAAQGRPPGRRRPAAGRSRRRWRRPCCTAWSRSRCSRRACST